MLASSSQLPPMRASAPARSSPCLLWHLLGQNLGLVELLIHSPWMLLDSYIQEPFARALLALQLRLFFSCRKLDHCIPFAAAMLGSTLIELFDFLLKFDTTHRLLQKPWPVRRASAISQGRHTWLPSWHELSLLSSCPLRRPWHPQRSAPWHCGLQLRPAKET